MGPMPAETGDKHVLIIIIIIIIFCIVSYEFFVWVFFFFFFFWRIAGSPRAFAPDSHPRCA